MFNQLYISTLNRARGNTFNWTNCNRTKW